VTTWFLLLGEWFLGQWLHFQIFGMLDIKPVDGLKYRIVYVRTSP